MDPGDLAEFLRDSLRKNSRIRLDRIREEDVLTKDLGFDSFALLNVVLNIEDRFEVEIDPSRLANLREITFGEFVALVGEHLRKGAAASPSGADR